MKLFDRMSRRFFACACIERCRRDGSDNVERCTNWMLRAEEAGPQLEQFLKEMRGVLMAVKNLGRKA